MNLKIRATCQIAKVQDQRSSSARNNGRYYHSYTCDLHDITTDFYYRIIVT